MGLKEPESLWIGPRLLPSKVVIFFFINFLSLARRFWNQILTCKGEKEKKSWFSCSVHPKHNPVVPKWLGTP